MNRKSASFLAAAIGIGAIVGCIRLASFAHQNYYLAEQHGQALGWNVPAQITLSTFAFVLGAVLLYSSFRLMRER